MLFLNNFDTLKNKTILVTGGAGFIGSNLVESLLKLGSNVRVLDNLSTGNINNLEKFSNQTNFDFIEGSITDYNACYNSLKDVDLITHQAALGSVPRSIKFPHNTHDVNATGFLNILHASKEMNIKRFVFASSSSVYGDCNSSPKKEGNEGNLLSPYAVTKELNEQYAKVYNKLYGIESIGLRYFNVFGSNQNPEGVYAAAIPKFIDKMIKGGEIVIHGNGEQTRDFTYVKNAVFANLLALSTENKNSFGQTYNVACGESYSLNQVIEIIKNELLSNKKYNENCKVIHSNEREGDIKHSLADISNIQNDLNYSVQYSFVEGIRDYLK